MNSVENYAIRYLEPKDVKDLDQYNALLRYTFQVTEEELNAAFRPNTKAVFGETIANPALIVLDIEKFSRAAHAHGIDHEQDLLHRFPSDKTFSMYALDTLTFSSNLSKICG